MTTSDRTELINRVEDFVGDRHIILAKQITDALKADQTELAQAKAERDQARERVAELESAKQLHADAVEIADSAARSDIECNCEWESTNNVRWHDTKNVCINPDEPFDFLKRAVRYLTARYLIERKVGDEHLVRFK